MRAPLSIVIPTLNAQSDLPGCLAALMEGIEAGLVRELILADGGSTDATISMATEVGAVVVTTSAGRGGQLAAGAASAAGEWLRFLHADTHLEPGWADAVQAHMVAGGAGYFRLAFRAPGLAPRIVAGWANLRARLFGLPYGDQGLVVPRDLYDAVGGMPELPLMEDVAMARALHGQLRVIPCHAMTGAARYLRQGWLRGGTRNLWTLARYVAGVDPAKLAREYERR